MESELETREVGPRGLDTASGSQHSDNRRCETATGDEGAVSDEEVLSFFTGNDLRIGDQESRKCQRDDWNVRLGILQCRSIRARYA